MSPVFQVEESRHTTMKVTPGDCGRTTQLLQGATRLLGDFTQPL